jgi:predicted nucleic acid-binding protein
MTAYFFDSSALLKRYVTEAGSNWVRELANPAAGHILIVSRITFVEISSALARLQREGTFSTQDIETAIHAFQAHWETQYQVVEIDNAVTQLASRLLFRHPLRAYDSVQLASSLKLWSVFSRQTPPAPYTFVCADIRLLAAAKAEGLTADNPLDHS